MKGEKQMTKYNKEVKKGEGQEVRPREIGKVHRHERIVRPILVKNIVQKNPIKDMYPDPERDHLTRDIELPIRTFNIHITQLDPGKGTKLHKHHNEAVLYVIEGKGYTIIQGKRYDWEQGDALYVPPFNWHANYNTGEKRAIYMGITNKRLLNWLGLDRWVEIEKDMPEEEVKKEIESSEPSPYSWYSITPERGVKFGKEQKYI